MHLNLIFYGLIQSIPDNTFYKAQVNTYSWMFFFGSNHEVSSQGQGLLLVMMFQVQPPLTQLSSGFHYAPMTAFMWQSTVTFQREKRSWHICCSFTRNEPYMFEKRHLKMHHHSDPESINSESPACRLFVQQLEIEANNQGNSKALHYWPFVRGSTGDWVSSHKVPVQGGNFMSRFHYVLSHCCQ